MVKSVVYNQETVMNIRSCAHIYRCVLVVVSLDIQTQIVVNPFSVYGGEYASVALIQQCKDCLINIIVNQNDAFVGTTDEVADENVSVEYLTVEKNALTWRQRGF